LSRRIAREKAMQIIFQWEIARMDIKDAINNVLKDAEIDLVSQEFTRELVEGTISYLEKIDELINENTVKWQLDRIGNVEKAVLRLAIYELLYKNTPRAVAINEAVNLVKVFSSQKAASFVNAILDKIADNSR
jgi:N utilization substance protein B